MSYTVLARKYRPQTFADLSGQEHVTRTLGNALTSGRVAHAFLFTGVRGVGKTTTARILAKALNCEKGPTPAPCGVCDICVQITAGNDLDVLEIDGASNNGVEEIRRLQETIPFRPARDRFKIVIVDEVHMLSVAAFNAFLKTLEEPPSHVKFILATTESHKVPITVRSRCQRYDFRLIPHAVVGARVREILAAEKIEADDAAVALVSREAAGSMRDALTLLDQIVAFSPGKLVGTEIASGLGIADREAIFAIATAILDADGATVLSSIDSLAQRGLDLLHFSRGLVDLLRDLVVLRVSGEGTDLVSLVDEERTRAFTLAKRIEPLELQRAFHASSLLVEEIGTSTQPKVALEMGLVRLATRPPLRAIGDVLLRLEELERRLAAGGAGGTSAPGTGGGRPAGRGDGGARADNASSLSPGGAPPSEVRSATASDAPAPRPEPPLPAPPSAPHAKPPAPVATASEAVAPSPAFEVPARAAPPSAAPPIAPAPPTASSGPRPSSPPPSRASSPPVAARIEAPPVAISRAGMASWEAIVAALSETRPPIGAILQHAAPTELSPARIVLTFPRGSFYATQAASPEAKDALAETAERSLGRRPVIEIQEADGAPKEATLAHVEDERQKARLDATRKKALNHPVVVEALAIFESTGKPVEVRVDD